MKKEMWIENEHNIGDMVKFGPYMSIVTGIRLTGEPLNILYEISYFNGVDVYVTMVVNEYELESEQGQFGFGKKGEKDERPNGCFQRPS